MAARKKGLGKGLAAILSDAATTARNISSDNIPGVTSIPVDKIVVPSVQPRKDFDEEALRSLAESIRRFGILQPIVVERADNEKYVLIAGERRLRAAKMVGLSEVPAFIRPKNKEPRMVLALVENLQREDLNPIEIALTYKHLLEEHGLTHEELAEMVGVGRSTITNFLRLLKLPPEVQVALRQRRIDMGHARALLSVGDVSLQLELLRKIIEQELSVRETERLVKRAIAKVKNKEPNKHDRKDYHDRLDKLEDKLKKVLGEGMKVSVSVTSKGKIRITLSADSYAQLLPFLKLCGLDTTEERKLQ